MAAPIVSGAAALLLQANPKLTPNMVKMILMYTAQPIKNANMLEQGTGQLNIEGAVRVAKQIRTDLNGRQHRSARAVETTPLRATTTKSPVNSSLGPGQLVNYPMRPDQPIMKYSEIMESGV